MEKEVEVHAYHGWGFDTKFWNPIKSELPDHILLKPADRGYFGGEFIPEFDNESKNKILFLHSFGLHWCPAEKKEQADLIIIFNGFNTFHPLENPAKSRSKKILKGMVKEFKKEPALVLKAFYKNCFSKFETLEPNLHWLNRSLLLKDLNGLHKTKLKLTKETKCDWLIIDSEKDRIVSRNRGKELLAFLGAEKYQKIEHGVHALPATNPEECIKILSEAFPIFKVK
tara:strand:+ start:23052 stop:23732 length:681 start_codon:yes stop_codon:yes gene_type:complete